MPNNNQPQRNFNAYEGCLTLEQMNIILASEGICSELPMWMNSLLMSTVGKTADGSAVLNRAFIGVPTKFYNVLTVFYGTRLAQEFRNLLASFIHCEWMVMEAVNNKDTAAADAYTIRWYSAADSISSFLAQNNVYWDETQWKRLLYQYIRISIECITSAVEGDFEREIELYDSLRDLACIISSYLSRGIIARNLAVEMMVFT